DLAHRQSHGVDLVEQGRPEGAFVASVGMPVAIEGAEAGGGQRLIDRGPVVHPRIAARDLAGVAGQAVREAGIKQAGPGWAGAVVDEPDHGPELQLPQARQPAVGPAPVEAAPLDLGALPKDRIAKSPEPERREAIQIVDAVVVAGEARLVQPGVADTIDGALVPAPEFELRHATSRAAASRRAPKRGARRQAAAVATISPRSVQAGVQPSCARARSGRATRQAGSPARRPPTA